VLRDATGNVTAMRFWPDGEGAGTIAALTYPAVPIDLTLPRDAPERVVGTYAAPAFLSSAAIVLRYATKAWRRRKRPSGKRAGARCVRDKTRI
jgi:hypothetical protein